MRHRSLIRRVLNKAESEEEELVQLDMNKGYNGVENGPFLSERFLLPLFQLDFLKIKYKMEFLKAIPLPNQTGYNYYPNEESFILNEENRAEPRVNGVSYIKR